MFLFSSSSFIDADYRCGDYVSGTELECLRHLRELKADGNLIAQLDSLARLTGLVKVSLRGNALVGLVDFAKFNCPRLEVLDLSENRVRELRGVGRLKALVSLNLGE